MIHYLKLNSEQDEDDKNWINENTTNQPTGSKKTYKLLKHLM